MDDLKNIRVKINEVDEKMAKLFESRMDLAKQVALYKKETGLPITDSNREAQVIEKNVAYINNDEIKDYYVDFIKDTMTISKKYQSKLIEGMKIAYSGIEGSFAHIACLKLFPLQKLLPFSSFLDAYNAVEKGYCDACVLPFENSYAGDVGEVNDLIFQGSLFINDVIDLDVTHNLLAKKGVKLEDIKNVISHPQALSQCHKFLNSYKFNLYEATNTAIASKKLAESEDCNSAVIASEEVAKLYGLEIIKENINEVKNNTTRFAVFTKHLNTSVSLNKMGQHFILVFTVKNEAGALAKTLNIIGSYGFNMRTLRSRPMKELQWNYYFFIEADGDINSLDAKEMIRQLKTVCDRLKVVGNYYSIKEK